VKIDVDVRVNENLTAVLATMSGDRLEELVLAQQRKTLLLERYEAGEVIDAVGESVPAAAVNGSGKANGGAA
jgi:secreted protein with Ig-like and vWFA domain